MGMTTDNQIDACGRWVSSELLVYLVSQVAYSDDQCRTRCFGIFDALGSDFGRVIKNDVIAWATAYVCIWSSKPNKANFDATERESFDDESRDCDAIESRFLGNVDIARGDGQF